MNVQSLITLLKSTALAALVLFAFFLLFYLLERWFGGDPSRYRSRHFRNDVIYALFYRGELYQLLIGATVATALKPHLAFLEIGVFKSWPLPAAAIVFWITADFLGYWVHRLQHRVPFLWAFHSVHHAPERMTFLTSYRIHPVEQLLASLILFVPLLVIGLPPGTWLPLVAVLTVLEFAQHADLPWRFGPLYSVLVSPAFHAIHHSTEPRHYDRNFGKILSTWDAVFGTAINEAERPRSYGVKGLYLPESLGAQLVTPFRLLREGYARTAPRRQRSLAAVSLPEPSPTDCAIRLQPEVVSKLLKLAGTVLECELRGSSMGATLPDGARLRLEFAVNPAVAVGEVIAFSAGTGVTVHRVVGRGLLGPARSFVITRGDGAVLVDQPVHVRDILGVVREWKNGGLWERVPDCRVSGWRHGLGQMHFWPILLALHIDQHLAKALVISGFATRAVVRRASALSHRRSR